jgi:subtilisin family serine protease
VYVVDSGVDTDHVELTGSTDREVRNVFDVNYAAGQAIPRNNDLMGHGTHCSGIIGGKSVGVSPSSNIYGVKVMANNGQGYDGDIIRGLQFVYDDYIARGRRPTVINMSVGGPCGSIQDCQQDTIVQAVETLVKHGIVVVVAAGNSKCDACLLTPAFAPSAITVGAIDRHDKAGIFSDFGMYPIVSYKLYL